MKKIFLFVMLLLAACQPMTPFETPIASPSPGPTSSTPPLPTFTPKSTPTPWLATVAPDLVPPRGERLVLWHAMTGETAVTLTHMIAVFNTSNEWDISIYPQAFATYAELYAALDAALDGDGDPPDILIALPAELAALDEQGVLTDLLPYWMDADWGFSAAARDAFYPALLTQTRLDGRQLGLPAQQTVRGLFYNRTWAQEMGFDAPPQDAESFRAQVCAANQTFRLGDEDETNDGLGGWLIDGDPQTALGWMAAFEGGAASADAYQLNTDENTAALTYVKTLYDEACAWMVDPQSILPPYYDQFATRRALVISGNLTEAPWLAAHWQAQNATDAWTLIPFPGPRRGAYVLSGSDFALLKTTPARNLAGWLFLRWMLSPEQQIRWVTATGYLPARQDVYVAMTDYRRAHPQWDDAVAQLNLAVNPPLLASWPRARAVIGDGFYIFFYQNWPVDDAPALLDRMQSTIESLEE